MWRRRLLNEASTNWVGALVAKLAGSGMTRESSMSQSVIRKFLILHAAVVDVVEAYFRGAPPELGPDVRLCWALEAPTLVDGYLTEWFRRQAGPGAVPPILVILDAQLLTLERRAALLWRADRAKVHVIMVVPTLSPDDIRIVMKSLTFVGEVIQCPPTQALYVSCVRHGEIEEAKLRPIVLQLRVLRLVFGSSVSLKKWARVAAVGSTATSATELSFMRSASDRFYDDAVMRTFLTTVKAALATVVWSKGPSGFGTTPAAAPGLTEGLPVVSEVALECVQHVLNNGDSADLDVPFEWFLGAHQPCQFARQSARLQMWRHAISGCMPADVTVAYDVQTNKALSCFTSSEHRVGHAYLNIAVDGPSLRLSQSVVHRELDWAGMCADPTFPGSWEFLCRLCFSSNQSLRVVTSVAPSVLFEMMSGISESKSEDPVVATVIDRLLDELEDPFVSGVHALAAAVHASFGTSLAVLRWCLCQTEQARCPGRFIALLDSDFQVLTEMGLSMDLNDRKTTALFPKLKSLGDNTGREGILLSDTSLKNALLRNALLVCMFPRPSPRIGAFEHHGAAEGVVDGRGSQHTGVQAVQGNKRLQAPGPDWSSHAARSPRTSSGPLGGDSGPAAAAATAACDIELLSVGATIVEFVMDVPQVELSVGSEEGDHGLLDAPFVRHIRDLSSGKFTVGDDAAPSPRKACRAYLDSPVRWRQQVNVVFGPDDGLLVAQSYAMLDATAMVQLATRAHTPAVADWLSQAALYVATVVLDSTAQQHYVSAMVKSGLNRLEKRRSVGTQLFNFFGRLLGKGITGAASVLSGGTRLALEPERAPFVKTACASDLTVADTSLGKHVSDYRLLAHVVRAVSAWTLTPLLPVAPLGCLETSEVCVGCCLKCSATNTQTPQLAGACGRW